MLKKLYLIAYNAACFAGWGYCLVTLAQHMANGGAYEDSYPLIAEPLKWAQTAAILEVFHSLFGIVRSPFMSAFMQVSSRILVLWVYLIPYVEAQQSMWATVMVLSWSATEVPRYLFYLLKELNMVPGFLTVVRYSTFIPLYPSGITGELMTIKQCLDLPVAFAVPALGTVSLLHISYFVYAVYVPGSPYMYSHMVKQRKSVLKKLKAGAGKKN